MAWRCLRCDKNIFAPREHSIGFAMRWTYSRKYKDLLVDIVKIADLSDSANVTHLACKGKQIDGFADRVKRALLMPMDSVHPLLV